MVETKKKLFNNSMNRSMTLGPMSCGVLHNEGSNNNDIDPNSPGTGGSDRSLDNFNEEEEEDDELPHRPGQRRISANESANNSSSQQSEALGIGNGPRPWHTMTRITSVQHVRQRGGILPGDEFHHGHVPNFLSEEETFWLLVVVMNDELYKLRELFGGDMAGLHEVLYIAEKLFAAVFAQVVETFGGGEYICFHVCDSVVVDGVYEHVSF